MGGGDNEALVRRPWEEVWNGGRVGLLPELVAAVAGPQAEATTS